MERISFNKIRVVVITLVIISLGLGNILPEQVMGGEGRGDEFIEEGQEGQEGEFGEYIPVSQVLRQDKLEEAGQEPLQAPEYVPGQLIVKLKEGKVLEDIQELNAKYNVTSTERVFRDTPDPKQNLEELKDKLSKLSPEHQGWYWQMDKESQEYKDYLGKLEEEKQTLQNQIQVQEELITHLEERQERAPEGAEPPKLDTTYSLETSQDIDIPKMAEDYKNNPAVEYAEPNYIVKLHMVPNDPYYSSSGSWGQDYDDLWGLKKIGAEKAWDISQGEGVVVA
ncbi:MAG: hypothetical protein HY878_00205, partial [Deltaproteobacteria bacterium]|nr:hypothetical protein [Deltaproteobacteria bacterium]